MFVSQSLKLAPRITPAGSFLGAGYTCRYLTLSSGIRISAPSASIARWRASSASFSLAAALASLSATCCGNSSSFFEPSMKWMMMPRFSLMPCFLPSHRLQVAGAQRYPLADVEAVAVAPLQRAMLAVVHAHRHLVVCLTQPLAHLRRAGRAEVPRLRPSLVELEARHGADHRAGIERGSAADLAGRARRARRGRGRAQLAHRAHLA